MTSIYMCNLESSYSTFSFTFNIFIKYRHPNNFSKEVTLSWYMLVIEDEGPLMMSDENYECSGVDSC